MKFNDQRRALLPSRYYHGIVNGKAVEVYRHIRSTNATLVQHPCHERQTILENSILCLIYNLLQVYFGYSRLLYILYILG
jgi:hypothetical protein